MRLLIICLSMLTFSSSFAQETAPEVGKHVGGSMDSMSMILSLLMVLALIIASAWVLKRFQTGHQNQSGLKVVANLHLSNKERLIVVQAGKKQLLLGVTAQQISLLDTLDEPLTAQEITSSNISTGLGQSILSLITKQKEKN